MTRKLSLTPTTPAEFSDLLKISIRDFSRDLEHCENLSPTNARFQAQGSIDELLTNGLDTPSHYFKTVRHGDQRIGMLWYGIDEDDQSLFVYDILIEEAHRRKGHARQVFAWLGVQAKEMSLRSIKLNVFAHNKLGRAFYSSLGFQATHITLRQPVGA